MKRLTKGAIHQAEYRARQRKKGRRGRLLFLTDEEIKQVRLFILFLRGGIKD